MAWIHSFKMYLRHIQRQKIVLFVTIHDVVVDLLLAIGPNARSTTVKEPLALVVDNRVVVIMRIVGGRGTQHGRITVVVDDDVVVQSPHAFPAEVQRAAVVAVDVVVVDLRPLSRQRQFANVHIKSSSIMPRVVVELAIVHGEMPQAAQRSTRAPPRIIAVESAILHKYATRIEHIHGTAAAP